MDSAPSNDSTPPESHVRTMTAEEWLVEAQEHPWTVIADALLYEAEGLPLPEEVSDAAYMAGTMLAAGTLVKAGCDIDAVERQFVERDYSLRFTYHRDSDEFGVVVEWEDGTVTTAQQGDDDA